MTEDKYQQMVARGINMSWYERNNRSASVQAPLNDTECSPLSVYLLQKDGSLWTIYPDGEAYRQVRAPTKTLPKSVYLCLHCKAQAVNLDPDPKKRFKHEDTN